jgi:flagellar basal body-associated protein FliL
MEGYMRQTSDEIFADIPKTKSSKPLVIVLIVFIVLCLAGGATYYFWPNANTSTDSNEALESLITNDSAENQPDTTNEKIDSTKSIETNIGDSSKTEDQDTAKESETNQYALPTGETFILANIADTNGDKKKETIVVSKRKDKKYHVYVLSSTKKVLYENTDLTKAPVRIEPTRFQVTTGYDAWMLIFAENSGELGYLVWNGTAYEIPSFSL